MRKIILTLALVYIVHGTTQQVYPQEAVNLDLNAGTIEGQRIQQTLNGEWGFLPIEWEKRDQIPPTDAQWGKIKVPSYWDGKTDEDVAWYRKEINISGDWKGKELVVYFERVNYQCWVYVNGKLAGEHFGGAGLTSFEIDITPYVKKGNNELWVKVVNALVSAYKPPRHLKKDLSDKTKEEKPKSELIAFVHAWMDRHNGIGGDVNLLICRSKVYTDDAFIKTSVKDKKLALEATLKNDDNKPHTVDMVSLVQGTKIKLEQKNINLEPNSTKLVKLETVWKDPILWSPDNPHLYYLETKLIEQKTCLDIKSSRFGFREFGIEKNYFVLNGKKIRLLYECVTNYHIQPGRNMRESYTHFKDVNVRCLRIHMQAAYPSQLDLADEMGLLIINESGLFCWWSKNPEYWKNTEAQFRNWIKRDRNHPSVIIWSAENELLSGLGDGLERPPMEQVERLKQLGDCIKEVDPTRPVMYASDGDLFGHGEMYDFHYAHEYSCYNLTDLPHYYYNFWEDNFLRGYLYRNWQDEPLDLTKKPICMTEEYFFSGPGPAQSVLIGGLAYEKSKEALNHACRAHAMLAKMGIEADKYYDLALPGNYDMSTKARGAEFIRDVYKPLCIHIKEYNKTFYENARVKRTVTVYNDSLNDAELKLVWETGIKDKSFQSGQIKANLKPGYFHRETITLNMPAVDKREKLSFVLKLHKDGKIEDVKEKLYHIFPKAIDLDKINRHKIFVFEKALNNESILALKDTGLKFSIRTYDMQHQRWLRQGKRLGEECRIKRLDPQIELLIIGKDSLQDFRELYIPEEIKGYLSNGGKILCLEQQDVEIEDWFGRPVKLMSRGHEGSPTRLANYQDGHFSAYRNYNFIFPVVEEGHPILDKLILKPTDDPIENALNGDLSLWGEDGVVSRSCFEKPEGEDFIRLLEVGGWFYGSPALLEVKSGKGRCIFSQLDIIGKIGSEPLARRILINLIDYLTNEG